MFPIRKESAKAQSFYDSVNGWSLRFLQGSLLNHWANSNNQLLSIDISIFLLQPWEINALD